MCNFDVFCQIFEEKYKINTACKVCTVHTAHTYTHTHKHTCTSTIYFFINACMHVAFDGGLHKKKIPTPILHSRRYANYNWSPFAKLALTKRKKKMFKKKTARLRFAQFVYAARERNERAFRIWCIMHTPLALSVCLDRARNFVNGRRSFNTKRAACEWIVFFCSLEHENSPRESERVEWLIIWPESQKGGSA